MSLEEIRGRLQAATPGPWAKDAHGTAKLDSIVFKAYSDKPGGWIEVARSYGADTEFIAHAPEDVRRLLNALESVLGRHQAERRWMISEDDDRSWDSEDEAREWMDGDEPEGELPFFEVCAECKRVEEGPCDGECTRELGYRESMWPCPTVKAITSALVGNR